MAKAASPIRLQQDLMQAATVAGEQLHRSTAEQIEYWASIGRSVSAVVDPDSLLAISAGLARLKIEAVAVPEINPDDVFASMETKRQAGSLAASVSASAVRYQASVTYPGQLEQVQEDGTIVVGQFCGGVFTPVVTNKSAAAE